MVNGVAEVSADELFPHLEKVKLVDVRRPDEFSGELGHIPGSELVTLGPELVRFLQNQDRNQQIVFICKSGVRSREACLFSQQMGFKSPINLQGGMISWNSSKLPTE
ncbi:rhodanese-like domain-containing protein [bacterium]|nr:rhodanese-like domain-containing protein [bacterium]